MDKCVQNQFNMPSRATEHAATPLATLRQRPKKITCAKEQGVCMIKGQRKVGNGFDLSEAPSHLIRRCQQFYGDLYAREAGARELTKQQFMLLAALEQNDGA